MTTATVAPAPMLTRPGRISLATTLSQSVTMAYRGLLKVRHTPEQLIDVTIQPIIFTLMFTYLFGGAVSGSVAAYLPLIIPGILAQTVITASVVTGVQLREDMDKGVFDRFRSLPIARIAPLAGALLADTVRYVVATTITFLTGLVMGWRPGGGFGGVVLAGLLVIVCAWALSWIFAYIGVIARSATFVQGVSFMVLFPLTFLSNAFVEVSTLPGWMQALVEVNPVSHLVSSVRALANDGAVTGDVGWTLLSAGVVAVVFAPIAVRAYLRKA
ncbi:ABC transporter permease [Promicromonospora sp. MS192]|uniref:ABC transporter permease n=1 Tax=Promicromonospora sp. MS192 TaxID=3412684 RepID=UPI003C2FC024